MSSLQERVAAVAARMTIREPFIASVFTRLPRLFGKEGTAWVDGKSVYFGEDFCDKLTDEQLLFVAMHESAHVIFMHMWRRDGRNMKVWNYANDAIINRMLVNLGYKMPEGGVMVNWVTADMSSEEVYRRLMDETNGGESLGGGDDAGGFDGQGDLHDAPDDADLADMEATIMTAAKMSKACGSGGAFVDRILGGELAPRVPWTEVLRQVMTASARSDYTYRRFNRRLMPQGVYMPSLYSEAMGGLVVGVDTSGSVSDKELQQIAAEITAIAEDCRPEWVEVVYCDTDVKHTERFVQGDAIELHPKGGGGTAFKPVFDYVSRLGDKVAALVYLTDLEGDTNACDAPEFPVLWGVTSGARARSVPFGQIVEVM